MATMDNEITRKAEVDVIAGGKPANVSVSDPDELTNTELLDAGGDRCVPVSGRMESINRVVSDRHLEVTLPLESVALKS